MNKQQKIGSLTWRYFWQQKVKELSYLICVILIPFLLGKLAVKIFGRNEICSFHNLDLYTCNLGYIDLWLTGFLPFLSMGIIYVLLHLLITSNWDKAKRRAKEEIKNVNR